MTVRRWLCPNDGQQETYVQHGADAAVRCPVCGRPMQPADSRVQPPRDGRQSMPPRGRTAPL